MGKASRKAEQKAIRERVLREQREARANPDLPPDERAHFDRTVSAFKSELDRAARPASLAKLTEVPDTARSHAGGAGQVKTRRRLFRSDVSDWPEDEDGPLTLLLSLAPVELAVIPPALDGIALFQLFVRLEQDDPPRYSGGAWAILTHSSTEGLVQDSRGHALPNMPLHWAQVTTYPGYPDDIDALDQAVQDAFDELPDSAALYGDLAPGPGFGGVRVGGWASWVSDAVVDGYVLQIEGREIGVDMGFDGMVYVGRGADGWQVEWAVG